MIALSFADYTIIAVVFAAILLRTLSDIREVVAAQAVKRATKEIIKKRFTPRLTVVVRLRTLENAKRTLQHLQEMDFPLAVVVVAGTALQTRDARALRYFIEKNALSRASVAVRKKPQLLEVAGKYAKNGLVVTLPDTARLTPSFYWDAVVPFGDSTIDAVSLASGIRPDNTLVSGMESLFFAWRRYVGLGGRAQQFAGKALTEGMIIRAKFSRKLPKKNLRIVRMRTASYSVAAESPASLSAHRLFGAVSGAEYMTVLVAAIMTMCAVRFQGSLPMIAGIAALLFVVVAWWALGTARVLGFSRTTLMLLVPFFVVLLPLGVVGHIVWLVSMGIRGVFGWVFGGMARSHASDLS